MNRLAAKVDDLRWHVASKGHDSFAITKDYDDETSDWIWVITCCADPRECTFARRITESDAAEAGCPELFDGFGIGALVESVKREARREAPKAWDKLGELDFGEDEAV